MGAGVVVGGGADEVTFVTGSTVVGLMWVVGATGVGVSAAQVVTAEKTSVDDQQGKKHQ